MAYEKLKKPGDSFIRRLKLVFTPRVGIIERGRVRSVSSVGRRWIGTVGSSKGALKG